MIHGQEPVYYSFMLKISFIDTLPSLLLWPPTALSDQWPPKPFCYETFKRSSSAAKSARRKRSSSLKRQPSTIRRQPSRRTINQQAAGKSVITSEARKQSSENNPMGTLIGHHRYTGKPRQLISRRKSYQRAMNHQNLTKTSRQNAIR